ncbi:MAG: carboxypeptidase M32 [Acholeplasma sp.]|nr:carboxypeptidase M32 [Acholeplasma sp.]
MNYLETYLSFREKKQAYNYAMWLISWDQETEAPKQAMAYRSKQIEMLSTLAYEVETDPLRIEAIDKLSLDNTLSVEMKREIYLVKKSLDEIRKIPKKAYIDFQVLLSQAGQIWAESREKNDFEGFMPTLEKVIDFQKTMIKYLETDTLKGYDVLLDMYEPGMKTTDYDVFFETLKEKLVPFAKKAASIKQVFPKTLKRAFPKDKQKVFNQYLLEVFSYNMDQGVLKESQHPFTSGVASVDTRITTSYHDDVRSAIFSTIHEMGHGIYEQQVNKDYDNTELNGGVSMGIHESQSRMYENMIGRSHAFWDTHYEKLQSLFPKELKKVTKEDFIRYVNEVKMNLIRVEADELTYSLHIMVRYEIEKMLFNGKLKVKDLPKTWNKLYKSYLGIKPKTDSMGVLQDIHWSVGSFGYFPTYALGSAISAQIYQKMNQELPIESLIRNNEISQINEWLKQHIHQYGKLLEPKALLLKATKEAFNPDYYVTYLIEKYRLILGIEA